MKNLNVRFECDGMGGQGKLSCCGLKKHNRYDSAKEERRGKKEEVRKMG